LICGTDKNSKGPAKRGVRSLTGLHFPFIGHFPPLFLPALFSVPGPTLPCPDGSLASVLTVISPTIGPFICKNDEDAVIWARQFDSHPIELWRPDRLVIGIEGKPSEGRTLKLSREPTLPCG
jgi:hypothetical protein